MKIDWNKIKKDYPKSYEKFWIFIKEEYKLKENQFFHLSVICYCEIEKFFDDNGIEIFYIKQSGFSISLYAYKIIGKVNYQNPKESYKLKSKAKEQAIYKAFEVMEGNNEK